MSPEMLFLVDLALKMALTAFIVVVISITVAQRSGPFKLSAHTMPFSSSSQNGGRGFP